MIRGKNRVIVQTTSRVECPDVLPAEWYITPLNKLYDIVGEVTGTVAS